MNYKNLEFILRPHTIDQYFKRVIQVRPLQLQRQSEDIKLSIFFSASNTGEGYPLVI